MDDTIVDRLNAALEGRYEIERVIGEGGMAAVYLAADLRHDRNVALKVLKPELAAVIGAARFLTEIRTTANLQHPHILPLFDSGDAGGFLYYVMPYIEGESLRARLTREEQLPVAEAVRIAGQVASALGYAHEQGVIHRDIKPANILLSRGEALVADFGIALAVSAAGGGRLTETGMSLGTPHYMSPEQATGGERFGAETDVYSLGCVLYEMLVGEPPHAGRNAQTVLAHILTGEIKAPRESRPAIPINVDAAIRKALERVPADRFRSTDEFARALTNPAFRLESDATVAVAHGRWARYGPVAAGLAAVALALAAWGWMRPAPEPPVSRYEMVPPMTTGAPINAMDFDVAPDGSYLAYAGRRTQDGIALLWIKAREQSDWIPVPGTEGAERPRVSPNGTRVAYGVEERDEIRVVSLQGGASTRVAENAGVFAWLDDESLVADVRGELLRVGVGSAGSEVIWGVDAFSIAGYPTVYDGGAGVLVALCDACPLDLMLYSIDVSSGEARPVYPALYGVYGETGDIVMVEPSGSVLAAPFDPSSGALTDDVTVLFDGVSTISNSVGLVLSKSGIAIAVLGPQGLPSASQESYSPVWIARDGTETPAADDWTFQLTFNFGLALSPDGDHLAIGLHTSFGGDVWLKKLPDGPLSRLTLEPEVDARPAWSADGAWIWYQSDRAEGSLLFRRRADGVGAPEHFPTPGRSAQQFEPSPDGEWMIVRVDGRSGVVDTGRDIVAYRTDGDSTEVPILTTEYDEFSPNLSPDGRWLAYVSTEADQPEVHVRPFPNVDDRRWPVSSGGGTFPLWKGDNSEIYYLGADRVMYAASIEASDPDDTTLRFDVLSRDSLFTVPPEILTFAPWEPVMDVQSDGSRFLMLRALPQPTEEADPQEQDFRLVLIENFWDDVSARRRGSQ